MAEKRVRIEHPKTTERFEVALADFGKRKAYRDPKHYEEFLTYEEAGFRITHYADGGTYEPPAAAKSDESKASAGPTAGKDN